MRRVSFEPTDERGVVAVVVAISLVALLGIAALVVDVGALYQERRELQNGADAAALAVAKDCSLGDCGVPTDTAQTLAAPNANDDATAVDGVTISMTDQTAKVDTSTLDAGGGSVVSYNFARVFGKTGKTVGASATATWGAVGRASALPLVVSKCEWDQATGGSAANLPTGPLTLTFHDGNNTESCNPSGSGSDVPGGFGWLDTTSACETVVDVREGSAWVSSDPGNSVPKSCDLSHFPFTEDILLPVFEETKGQGNKAEFRVVGYAGFRIEGFQLLNGNPAWTAGAGCSVPNNPTLPDPTGKPGKDSTPAGAGSDQVCLKGQFVEMFEVDAQGGGPVLPDLGARTAWLVA